MKILSLIATAVATTSIAIPSLAQEIIPSVVNVTPPQGEAAHIGTPEIEFNLLPSINKSCTETAKLYFNDELVNEISTKSNLLQMGVENQPENAVMFVFATKPMTEIGSYRFELPAEFFTFNSGASTNSAFTANWVISPKLNFSVTPNSGYYTSMPISATLIFDGVKDIQVNQLVKDDETGRGVILFDTPNETIEPDVLVMGNRVILNYPSNTPYTMKGTYNLDIPAGAFTLTLNDGTVMTNSPKMLTYYIPVVPYPSIEPAQGDLESLQEFRIYFKEEDKSSFYMFMRAPALYKSNAEHAILNSAGTCSVDGKKLPLNLSNETTVTFRLPAKISEPGHYVFRISRSSFGAFMEDYVDSNGDPQPYAYNNCDYLYYYYIGVNPATISFVDDNNKPAKTLTMESISEVRVLLESTDGKPVKADPSKVLLTDDFEDPILTNVSIDINDTRAGSEAVVRFNPAIKDKGSYVLFFKEGAFTVDGKQNPPTFIDIKVEPTSGITDVEEAPGTFDVYRIDGTLAGRAMTADRLKELPKGLYIVGKKKVIIK